MRAWGANLGDPLTPWPLLKSYASLCSARSPLTQDEDRQVELPV